METKDTAMINVRVTPEELQSVDAKAGEAGMTRTDYVRAQLFGADNNPRIGDLEKQLHDLTDRLGKEAERQETTKCNHRCSRPEHAKIWGVGYCFDCEMPMRSSH